MNAVIMRMVRDWEYIFSSRIANKISPPDGGGPSALRIAFPVSLRNHSLPHYFQDDDDALFTPQPAGYEPCRTEESDDQGPCPWRSSGITPPATRALDAVGKCISRIPIMIPF